MPKHPLSSVLLLVKHQGCGLQMEPELKAHNGYYSKSQFPSKIIKDSSSNSSLETKMVAFENIQILLNKGSSVFFYNLTPKNSNNKIQGSHYMQRITIKGQAVRDLTICKLLV